MRNADKYLKDGVENIESLIKDFFHFIGCIEDSNRYNNIYQFFLNEVKPTLTEDEIVILRNIDKKYKVILRQHNKIWIMEDNDGEKIYHGYCLDYYESNLFKFIQERRRIVRR